MEPWSHVSHLTRLRPADAKPATAPKLLRVSLGGSVILHQRPSGCGGAFTPMWCRCEALGDGAFRSEAAAPTVLANASPPTYTRRVILAAAGLKRLLWSARRASGSVLCLALCLLFLGPTSSAIAGALFPTPHRCACGMVRGQCGCPECARLERQRQTDDIGCARLSPSSRCGDVSSGVPLPGQPAVLPAEAPDLRGCS